MDSVSESGPVLPELFDVHVMEFADRGNATAAALEDLFSLDAAGAERLLQRAPVVVKRAATPEVAAALMDALLPLGAQVVLLPSALRDPSLAIPVERVPKASAATAAWGALQVSTPTPARAWPEVVTGELSLEGPDEVPIIEPLYESREARGDSTASLSDDTFQSAALSVAPASIDLQTLPPPPPLTAPLPRISAPIPRPPVHQPPRPQPKAPSGQQPVVERAPPPPKEPESAAHNQPLRLGIADLDPRVYGSLGGAIGSFTSADLEPERPRPLAKAAEVQPPAARSRGMALVELLLAGLVAYLGVRVGSSVIYGNANWLWLALHGSALFMFARGVLGMLAATRPHALWLLACLGAAVAVNQMSRPRLIADAQSGDWNTPTGSLALQSDGGRHEMQIGTVRVVATELRRLMAEPVIVRELWVQSPEGASGTSRDVELFLDFSAPDGRHIAPHARDIDLLRGRPLPVLTKSAGGTLSRLRLPGSESPTPITHGHLLIRNAVEFGSDQNGSSWRIEGEAVLWLEDQNTERNVRGETSARLRWE